MRKLILGLGLFVTACNSPAEEAEKSDVVAAVAVPTEQPAPMQVGAISTEQLAQAAGIDCKGALSSMRKGGTADKEFYLLRCTNTKLLVMISKDGSTNVLECSVADAMNTPCEKSWG